MARSRRQRTPRKRVGGRSSRGGVLDPDRVLSVLSAKGRAGIPATRLLRSLGADRGALRNLRRLLRGLEESGRVEKVGGGWRVPRADGLVEGEFRAADRGRGGTVHDDTGRSYRVPDAGDARSGSRVLIAPLAPGRGVRAELLQVVDRGRDRWVGILRRHGKWVGVGPYRDDADWFVRIARNDTRGARQGEVVSVVPVERPRRGKGRAAAEPWGRVAERFGAPGEADADFAAVVWRYQLPVEFPPEVCAEASGVDALDEEDAPARRDLRDLSFVTIDPTDARDHDDAVCVEARGSGFRLWVAIADVAHWVAPGSAIDREALRRGNSVYFPDRAIPMLPERLSSDLCSLLPEVDRFAMAVELDVDARGAVTRRRFHRAVIRSRARLDYAEAAAAMEGDSGATPDAAMLPRLADLSGRLGRRRRAAGSIDFELPSAEFVLDANGRPVDVRQAPRSVAHRAIEEAMLAANRAVAEQLVAAEVPAVHRVHEPPSPSEAEKLVDELASRGLLEAPTDGLSPAALARALERAAGHPAERVLHQLALRSMRRARYAAEGGLHFALAFPHYVHFTSPIRRYADLTVHRALKTWLGGRHEALSLDRARRVATRISFRERHTLNAEREMQRLKVCVFLAPHVGEIHEGAVSGVARHGVYVTLDAWWVEGLVHVSRLPEFVEFDERELALIGRTRRYGLGDRLRIRIEAADPVSARIDFALADEPPPRRESGRRRSRRPGS